MGVFSKLFKTRNGNMLNMEPIMDDIPLNEAEKEIKETLSKEINDFEMFKSEIQSYMQVSDEIESILNSPIEKTEKTLSSVLLPKFETKFLSFIAYVKIHKAKNEKSTNELILLALDVILYIVQLETETDCFDLLLRMQKTNTWPSSHTTENNLTRISFQTTRIEHIVNDGIIKEGGNMVEQIKRVQNNKTVNSQIASLLVIAGRLSIL